LYFDHHCSVLNDSLSPFGTFLTDSWERPVMGDYCIFLYEGQVNAIIELSATIKAKATELVAD
jgi:hypothetical protein